MKNIKTYINNFAVLMILLNSRFTVYSAAAMSLSELLIHEVEDRNIKGVEAMIKKGANINAFDIYGNTALNIAAHAGCEDIVDLLINKRANANAFNNNMETALMRAIRYSDSESNKNIVKALLDYKADPNPDLTDHAFPEYTNIVDSKGFTPLIWAIHKKSKDIAQLLLIAKANVDAEDKAGKTALIWAVILENNDIVNSLLNAGANTDVSDTAEENTALMIAASTGNKKIVELLLSYGADLNILNKHKKSAMHVANEEYYHNFFRNHDNYSQILDLLENEPERRIELVKEKQKTIKKHVNEAIPSMPADLSQMIASYVLDGYEDIVADNINKRI